MANTTTNQSLGLPKYPKEITDQLIAQKFDKLEPIKPVYPQTTINNTLTDYSNKIAEATVRAKNNSEAVYKKINEVDVPRLNVFSGMASSAQSTFDNCFMGCGDEYATLQKWRRDRDLQNGFIGSERNRAQKFLDDLNVEVNALIVERDKLKDGIITQYNTELKNYNEIYLPAWNTASVAWDKAERERVNGVLMRYNTEQAKIISDAQLQAANISSQALSDKIIAKKAGLSDEMIESRLVNNTPYIVVGVIVLAIAVVVALKQNS